MSVACTPPSGTRFSVGVTQAECVARDSLSRTGSCTFSVTVAGPPRLRRTRIMAWGDSLTEGYRVNPGDGWPEQLSALVGRGAPKTVTLLF